MPQFPNTQHVCPDHAMPSSAWSERDAAVRISNHPVRGPKSLRRAGRSRRALAGLRARTMPHWRIKLSLFLNYFVFAILLNSVGTVILQVQRNFGVTAKAASILEACKDMSIATGSFLFAAYIARYGYKRAMLAALGLVTAMCSIMPSLSSFMVAKLNFMAVGLSFGIIKVSVFGTLGLVARDRKEHLSLMSFLESCFMVGILSAYFIFSAFVDDAHPTSTAWFRVYYFVGAIAFVALLLLWSAPLDESKARAGTAATGGSQIGDMLRLAVQPLVIAFVAGVFVYVLTEQSIMSWLPTFNNRVLRLPATLSIEMASILAASTAVGRFAAGWVLRRLPWFAVIAFCLVCAATLVLVALPLARHAGVAEITGWRSAPAAAYVFPLIGFFIAPIYPVMNSIVLSSMPARLHGAMSGLIVVFSAIGGTVGSLTTGRFFDAYGGERTFYLVLIPIVALIGCLTVFNQLQKSAPWPDRIAEAGS